jgi:hypothetical protein
MENTNSIPTLDMPDVIDSSLPTIDSELDSETSSLPMIEPAPIPSVQPILRRSTGERRPNSRFTDHYIFSTEILHPNTDFTIEPRDFLEAMTHSG